MEAGLPLWERRGMRAARAGRLSPVRTPGHGGLAVSRTGGLADSRQRTGSQPVRDWQPHFFALMN